MRPLARATAAALRGSCALLASATIACSSGAAPGADAGADAGASAPFEPAPPTPPTVAPCAAGLSAVERAGVTTCEPWPLGSVPACADHEASFVGEGACGAIGTACAGDGWPSDLPGDRPALYVRAGSATGGAGTRSAPYATIAEAMALARAGDVIAVAVGAYDEPVRLRGGVTLWGACVAQTSIETTALDDHAGAVTVAGRDASIRNLRIMGERAGVWVDAQSVRLDDVEIAGVSRFGILVAFGGEVTGDHVLVRGTRARDARLGVGLYVSDAGRATLDHAALEGNTELGAVVTGDGSVLRLTRSSVVDTHAQVGGSFGRGVYARSAGRAELDTVIVEASREDGLLAEGAGSSMELASVTVRDTRARERDGVAGRGLEVTSGAVVVAHGFVAVANHEVAILVHDAGSMVALGDALVDETLPGTDGHDGIGMLVEGGALATVERTVVSASPSIGLLVRGTGSMLSLTDARISDGVGDAVDGASGHGIEANGGATLEGARVLLERNRQNGVLAFDAATRVTLSDVAVRDTLERRCALDVCADAAGGVGVAAVRGATVHLERFAIVRAASTCAQLVDDAVLELATGELAESPIGLNVQAPGVDLRALTANVTFRDNGRNLDSAVLPVPDPAL